MAGLTFKDFAGMFPIRDARSLPDSAAAAAVNARFTQGGIEPTRAPRLIKALAGTTRSVYRIPTGPAVDLAASFWMEFADANTDVIRTPVVNDSFERYYWCSPSTGFRYNTRARILAGDGAYEAFTQVPGRPALSVTPGTGAIDPETGKNIAPKVTRSYVVTFVTEFGEESQPGASREATGFSDADWVVSSIPQPVTQSGKPTVTTIRIYRTITSASGSTTFYRVVDLAVGATLYTDRLSDELVSGQGVLGSITYAGAPDMDGIALMPGGIFVGWKRNNLYFSEPFRPHAWPAEYTLTVQHPIVGLGVFGNTCVVCTQGNPATVTGTTPASMSLTTSDTPLPCLQRRSIVSAPEGVYFASPNGLALIGPGGMNLIAESIIGRDVWQSRYRPSTIQATLAYGAYAGFRTLNAGDTGFLLETTASFQATSPLPQAQRGVVDLDGFGGGTQVGTDVWSGKPWIITGGSLYEWLPVDTARQKVRWRSREVALTRPTNMGAAHISFDPADSVPAGEAALTLRVFADGILRVTIDATGRAAPIRLPGGFKATVWQVEVEGYCYVHEVQIAGSIPELRTM